MSEANPLHDLRILRQLPLLTERDANMSSTEVDDAMRRAEADQGRAVACGQAVADRYFLANEVKRLRDLYGSLDRENQRLRSQRPASANPYRREAS